MTFKVSNSILKVTLIALMTLQSVNSANILFTCFFGSLSHHIALHPLAVRLAENGHTVTYFSSLELKTTHSRITYFHPRAIVEVMSGVLNSVGDEALRNTNAPNAFTAVYPLAIHLCEILYESEEVQKWMATSKFDLLVIDAVYSDCALGLAYNFKAPYIFINPASFMPWQYDLYGIPPESSWIPDFRLNFTQEMGFSEKVYNTLFTLHMYLFHMSNHYYPQLTEKIRNGLKDPNVPTIRELQRNVSLLFVNSYFAAEYGRSLPPFVIPVGGLHCSTANQTLTSELEKFISKFENGGFVFISFGTAFKLSDKSMHAIFKVMSTKLKEVCFIFRWNGDAPKTIAKNVKFVPWAPQQLLLAHPNIRAFVSHCGMLSTNEAAYYGVPVLAIPGFADQDYNAECLVRLGIARRLELSNLNEQNFEEAMRKILFDKKYRNKMKVISDLYRDRPQSPLETALWWTEYVLRHAKNGNDLANMKPLGSSEFWFQRRLIDVYICVFVILALTIFLFVKLIVALITLSKRIFAKSKSVKVLNIKSKNKTS